MNLRYRIQIIGMVFLSAPAFSYNSFSQSTPATSIIKRDFEENSLSGMGLWSIELGSGVLWSNVRDSSIPGYTLVPCELTLARSLRTTCLRKKFRGLFEANPEILLRGYGTYIKNGIESRLAGFSIGMRYNFIHFSQKNIPFAEATVGAAWADAHPYVSQGTAYGLGQDFNFNFTVAAGLRHDWTEHCYTRGALEYTHYSNGGLSEPEHQNRAIDGLGFILSAGYRF